MLISTYNLAAQIGYTYYQTFYNFDIWKVKRRSYKNMKRSGRLKK